MPKLSISVIGAALAVCITVPATAGAASEYDDIINKVSTKTLIHHIDNYSGKTCGSPDDDYAKKWLFAFKQKRYYLGNPKDHQVAVESLERAMSSPKSAYAVVYEQNNGCAWATASTTRTCWRSPPWRTSASLIFREGVT